MKIIFLLILRFAFSQEGGFYSKGLTVGASIFAANKLIVKENGAKGKVDTNGVLGLNFGYHHIAREGSGFTFSLRLQEANKFSESGDTLELSNTVFALNYTYSVPENAYMLIGINHTSMRDIKGSFYGYSKKADNQSGGLGYQAGIGYLFGNFNFELVWQLLELENEKGQITSLFSPNDYLKLEGVLLNFNYIFK